MAISIANMKKCDPKCKCLFGPNEGIAYKCDDPCPPGTRFDPSKCDCVFGCYGPGIYAITWTADYTRTTRKNCGYNQSCSLNCDQDPVKNCQTESWGTTFFWTNIYAKQCIVSDFYRPFTDICGENRLRESGFIYACPEEDTDPSLGACGPSIAGFQYLSGSCSNGAIAPRFSINVVYTGPP